jgi:hygromycin-B 7''-O-kinase
VSGPLARLPADIGVAEFDALHDDAPRWRDVIATIAAQHTAAPVVQAEEGTALVALAGDDLVIKLYPPFLRDHFEFEAAALQRMQGRLSVPTPRLVDRAEHDGWPCLVMTQLRGTLLTEAWPLLAQAERCGVLAAIGRVAAEVHALEPGDQARLAPEWPTFLQRQRENCHRRQSRTGLPAHLLAHVDAFVAGPVFEGRHVILTGEYTPMNLLYADGSLSGMFDFGDGLVGPREYDWLGPLCFLAAGDAARVDAFLEGYGAPTDREWRVPAMRLLLLHRYSHLKAQIAVKDWEQAPTFEALAELIWP